MIADITPADDTVIFTIGPPPAGEWGKFSLDDLKTYLAIIAAQVQSEEFFPTTGTNQVVLSQTPNTILLVLRNGLGVGTSEYSNSGSPTITFTESFGPSSGGVGGETVIVLYI